jgi:transposase
MFQSLKGDFFPKFYVVTQRCGNSDGKGYVFELLSNSRSAKCPRCGTESLRAHSYQDRTVRDLPVFGESVTLLMSQQRYFCDNEECEVEIFTEGSSFVGPHYHFTERCREYMLQVAALVNCESAAKILAYQGIRVSGDTLLNMLKAAGKRYRAEVGRKIGVDDWAYRKGQEYGTIICDLETHEIIDVLEGRDSETFKKWLLGHPDIEIVTRDRASAYASAVNNVLPEAVQIADRFHITKNLLEALNETMKTFMPEVVEVPTAEVREPIAAPINHKVKKNRKHSNVRRLS